MDKKRVSEYIKKNNMLHSGDSVIAAVSGGADSVALLLLLAELSGEMDFQLFAVHVEHGIRGGESFADMRFTKELCEKLAVPVKVYHVDAPAFAAEQGIGLEEAARMLRYQALEEAADELQAYLSRENMPEMTKADTAVSGQMEDTETSAQMDWCDKPGQMRKSGKGGNIKIALAHHIQDQAETVLFRLARGSGIQGLSGMQPVRQSIGVGIRHRQEGDDSEPDRARKNAYGYTYIRPLLGTSRDEIEEYLAQRGQDHCVDSTNLDESYARNRIRSRVIPELTEVNSRAAAHIARAAEQAAEMTDYISAEARRELWRIASAEKMDPISHKTEENAEDADDAEEVCRISIEIPELLKLHTALQKEILRQALILTAGHERDLTALHVKQLLELTQKTSGKEVSLPYRVRAMREFDRLVLVREPEEEDDRMTMEKGKPAEKIFQSVPGNEEASDVILLSEESLEEVRITGETLAIELGPSEKLIFEIGRGPILETQKDPVKRRNCLETDKKLQTTSEMSIQQQFAFEKIQYGAVIRHRQPGDYFCMKDGHRKKLKQYLIEEKIPASERKNLWLLARGSQVIWVIGKRVDPFFLADAHTEYVLTSVFSVM